MMYVAKPNLNNMTHSKEFETKKECVEYLQEYTGVIMGWERNKKTKEIIYDWELIGKLYKA